MTILLTGADGYLGWPAVLKLSTAFPRESIIAVDNLARRQWVEDVGAISAIPLHPMPQRLAAAGAQGMDNIQFSGTDLTVYEAVRELVAVHRPEVVLHLAAQPSAPFADRSYADLAFTQDANVAMTRNILWALRESGLTRTHYIETTTTGIYGAPSFDIPEGELQATGADGRTEPVPYPNMAATWYHVSKGFNAANMRLMHLQTGMPVTDVRTSIIYGAGTTETRSAPELATRYDFDYYFGTIFNRWTAMAVIGEPITVYGTGSQIKPMIHLEDAARSLVNIVQAGNSGVYRVYNQLTEYVMIRDLAQMIADTMRRRGCAAEVRNITNPRVEREDAVYRYENGRFLAVLAQAPRRMRESIGEVVDTLLPYTSVLQRHRKSLMA